MNPWQAIFFGLKQIPRELTGKRSIFPTLARV